MRIAVIGAGAVGGYFGGRLALAGEDVLFVARGPHMRALQQSGLRVDSIDGDFALQPVQVMDGSEEIDPVDVVLLTVKSWQVPDAIATMRSLVGPDTVIVPLLNGVEAPDQLAAAYGPQHVAGGLCGLFGSVVGPGHYRNVMQRPFVILGELDDTRSARIEQMRAALEHAGVQATIAASIRTALWEKLLFVSPFGSIGAVTRAPIGVVRALPETRNLLEATMNEIVQVARACGVTVSNDAAAKALAMIDGSPEHATASMQRDIMAGRPSELESQVGVVVRMARDTGVDVPLHAYLYASLLPQERQARGELVFSV